MAENYYTRFSTTVSGGYTAGSGVLNVAATAGTAANFRVIIVDAGTGAYIALLKVTGVNSSTQYAVATDPGGTDANASSGDGVYAILTADALDAVLAPHVVVDGHYLTDGTNYYSGPHHLLCTLPSAGSFSWLTTQGGATETADGNALVLFAPASASSALRCRGMSIGGNTTLTAHFSYTATFDNNTEAGIGFRESGSSKLMAFNLSLASALSNRLAVSNWTNATTFSTAPYSSGTGADISAHWVSLRLVYTSGSPGTVKFYISFDDITWQLLYTANANSFFTTAPDQWFYYANSNTTASDATITLWSWKTS